MRLSEVTLANFRSCENVIVPIAKDLTVLVGENASGKSAVIDALRLATTPAMEGKGLKFSPEFDTTRLAAAGVSISATYSGLTEPEKSIYLAELVDEDDLLRYNVQYSGNADLPYWKSASHTVGKLKAEDAEPINRKRIAHVYLPPLRDAVRELDASSGERLAEVLKVLTAEDLTQRDAFMAEANETLAKIADLPLPKKAQKSISDQLNEITPPTRKHDVRLLGREHELRRLAGLLKVQLADEHIDPIRLASTGLGYANLIYIATIIIQLAYAKDYDLTLLLVEEPEAHLHPQLQSVLLSYLEKQAAESTGTASGLEPAGQVQVIVSTHSPNLASSVSIEKVVVVSRGMKDDGQWHTDATALGSLGLTKPEIRKLNRYLSVTRSSMLFARHVILVEGVAEAIIVPELARRICAENQDRLRHLASVTFVAIDGVDFEPYLKLLLSGTSCRVDKVIVITDGDPDKNGIRQGDERKKRYMDLFPSESRMNIFVGGTTLEAELFSMVTNESLLRAAFVEMHPKSGEKWDNLFSELGADPKIRASAFAKAINKKEGDIDLGKGDFAQIVCEALVTQREKNEPTFSLPSYLDQAVQSILAEVGPSVLISGNEVEAENGI